MFVHQRQQQKTLNKFVIMLHCTHLEPTYNVHHMPPIITIVVENKYQSISHHLAHKLPPNAIVVGIICYNIGDEMRFEEYLALFLHINSKIWVDLCGPFYY